MAVKKPDNNIILFSTVVSLVLAAAAMLYCGLISDVCSIDTFFITADQQGRGLYRHQKYTEAAERFNGIQWRAASLFRAGEFEQAAALYSGMNSAESAFNNGNALVMLGNYEEAIKSYDIALSGNTGWEDAEINRQIAAARAEMIKREGGDMTGGKLGADEIVFEKSQNRGKQDEQIREAREAGEADMQAMWLRRVQTRPADFLRAKFAFQHAIQTEEQFSNE